MSDDTQNLAAVEAILSERDALHGWLVRLEAAGSSAPESVRARVREDYEHRLAAVTERLREHADTIGNRLAADRAEHDDLAGRARISRDALAEAELRHAVGEYDSEQFERERGRHTGDLETYDLALAAVAERVARLEEVQALVRREPASPEPEAPVAEAAVPVVEEAPAPEPPPPSGAWLPEAQPEQAPPAEAPQPPVLDVGGDDEAALLAIFEPVEPTVEPDAAPDAAPADPVESTGPLSFTPAGDAPRAAEPPRADRSIRVAPSEETPRFVRPSPVKGSELVDLSDRQRMAQHLDTTGVELEPAPVLPEPEVAGETGPRTLRCGECGAMNRPLEWYCEKCGAELTAV